MADANQKTEQPTRKRLDQAREDGQYPSARQFLAGVQFCVVVALIEAKGGDWLDQTALAAASLFRRAFGAEVSAIELCRLSADLIFQCFLPLLIGGALLFAISFGLHLAFTKMGFTLKKLTPDLGRLNPVSKLRQMARQNLSAAAQAAILLPVFGFAVYAVTSEQLETFVRLPLAGIDAGMRTVQGVFHILLWRAAAVFFVFGCVDLYREKRRHSHELKMTKEEVKRELKESDGDPHVKAKIRSIRRDLARRRMMQAVPKATAVIVNPTHFAVALLYESESMGAPRVVAKGKNYLALRIRQKALEHGVPLIENPPLAQALYKSVDLGQEIPSHLYRAVAEILAYIFKLMRRR